MNRSTGNIILGVSSLFLMVYTAIRSLHIVQESLPADLQIIGYAALWGLDGGLLVWFIVDLYSAQSERQRAISGLMIVLQIIGLGLAVVGDTVLVSDPTGAPAVLRVAVLWALPLIIVANVAAGVMYHQADPGALQARREREAELEEKRLAFEEQQAREQFKRAVRRQRIAEWSGRSAQIAQLTAPAGARSEIGELLAQSGAQDPGVLDDVQDLFNSNRRPAANTGTARFNVGTPPAGGEFSKE